MILLSTPTSLRSLGWRSWVLLVCLFAITVSPLLATDWSSEIMYFVLLDRFQDGNTTNNPQVDRGDPRGFHGGDLRGLRERLDYLQGLGVTAVWVSPICRNRPDRFYDQQSYHGYWPWDFFTVDPRFGTMADLQGLARDLHQRRMKLVLDFVVNHAGYDAPLAEHFPAWFHPTGNITDWNDRQELETHRIFGLPDFASEKPAVKALFQAVAKHWISSIGPDGFRLDAVKHVPVGFWHDFNGPLALRQGPDFLLLGEMLDGDPKVIGRVLREGEFTSLFDYPLYYTFLEVIAHHGDARRLGSRFYEDRRYPEPNRLGTFLDNHDLDRFLTSCGGDRDRYKMALALLFTARGMPVLTYGDEAGLTGTIHPEPLNRCDMKFGADPDLEQWVRDLAHLRGAHPSLSAGRQIHLAMGPGYYAFARLLEDEVAVVALNTATRPVSLALPCGGLFPDRSRLPDQLGSGVAEVWGNKLELVLKPERLALFVDRGPSPQRQAAFQLAQSLRIDLRAAGLVPVTFLLRSERIPEQAVPLVIGSLPELGDWDPKAALPEMVRVSPGAWRATVPVPKHAVFEAKFCYRVATGTVWFPGENLFGETTDRPPKPLTATW